MTDRLRQLIDAFNFEARTSERGVVFNCEPAREFPARRALEAEVERLEALAAAVREIKRIENEECTHPQNRTDPFCMECVRMEGVSDIAVNNALCALDAAGRGGG